MKQRWDAVARISLVFVNTSSQEKRQTVKPKAHLYPHLPRKEAWVSNIHQPSLLPSQINVKYRCRTSGLLLYILHTGTMRLLKTDFPKDEQSYTQQQG